MGYNRYSKFVQNGVMKLTPFIKIPKRSSDQYIYYEANKTRLDLVSFQYYGDANYDWLIMQANAEYAPYEFMIPNGAQIRIPYPLDVVLIQYDKDIEEYKTLYGLDG